VKISAAISGLKLSLVSFITSHRIALTRARNLVFFGRSFDRCQRTSPFIVERLLFTQFRHVALPMTGWTKSRSDRRFARRFLDLGDLYSSLVVIGQTAT